MVEKYTIRTDLAMEQKERFESDHVEVSGVVLEEEYDEERELKITTVRIETENGAKMMGKPVGTYLTLEVPDMASADDGYHREISETLAGFLEKYVENEETKKEHSKEKGCSILTVGLGNREVTPDALGAYVVDQLNITRHMVQEYGRYGVEEESRIVSAIVPGVMAQTGMETAEIVQGVVKETKPDLVAPGVSIQTAAPGGGYVTVSGTSYATPFVTGSAAILMQWGIVEGHDPYLYGEKVKAWLRRGARPLPAFTEYPNEQVGYGALCVRESLP